MFDHVNNLSEADVELLETYLDGELAIADAQGLWRRLEAESALKGALDELRAARTGRLAVWESMAPAEAAATSVRRSVCRAVRRRHLREWANRGVAGLAAAAACLVVGFRIGWASHSGGPQSLASMPQAPTPVQVAIRDQSGNLVAAPHFDTQQEAVDFVNDLNRSQDRSEPREPAPNMVPASYEQY